MYPLKNYNWLHTHTHTRIDIKQQIYYLDLIHGLAITREEMDEKDIN